MNLFKRNLSKIIVIGLLVVMFVLMFFSVRNDSPIVDEIAHIPSGFSYVTTGDYRLNPEHPPLIKDLSAIPLVLWGAKFPYDYWRSNSPVVNNQWEIGWDFIYRFGNDPNTLILLAKIPIMLLSLLFGYFVYRWATELFGKKAGIFALILYVFNTNIIAHSRFVTTDLGISFALFLAMYLLYKYIKYPTKIHLLFAGLGFGLTLVTKFSAAILAPTFVIVFILMLVRKGDGEERSFLAEINDKKIGKRFLSGLVSFLIIGLIGIFTMWLFYIPHTINMPSAVQQKLIYESLPGDNGLAKQAKNVLLPLSDHALTKPLAQWFLGFFMVTGHVEGGHDAFLLGKVSNHGWWYYYPVTFALKTPIPIFAFFLLVIIFWKRLNRKDWFTEAYLWIIPVVLMIMGMQGKINLGIRYMLPVYAFIFIFLARLAGLVDYKALRKKITFLPSLIILLTLWYIAEAILIFPHYLAYYNEFIGSYKNGYKYLTDSNTDWGQDIRRLNDWTNNNNVDKIYVDVFPGAFPAKYYLGDKAIEWHVQNGKPQGYFALSATFFQNSRLKKTANNGMDYSWLDSVKPVANIGGSILIYKLN
ncbi:MAG: glycosyltransferase family 39 protein [bacterium]